MKIAITGGTGFVGGHLGRSLVEQGHMVTLLARGRDHRDEALRSLPGVRLLCASTTETDRLVEAFEGCDAVVHCAGINRQIGSQTYDRVHVEGTRAVVEAARRAGVRKVGLLSFLRARPDCGSAYHESKWEAEQILRPVFFRAPVFFHYALAWVLERLMTTPLVSVAQVRILSEGITEPPFALDELPADLTPRIQFDAAQIRKGLPEPGGFRRTDLRCCASDLA
jgi:uncharacterized protein YbjT (DUF2867 family)